MSTSKRSADFVSPEELIQALSSCSPADLLRLKQLAKLRAAGLSSLTWEDLLNESVRRGISGTRRWPRGIALVAFLAQTMRSVANEEWRRVEADPIVREDEILQGDEEETGGDVHLGENAIHPEREAIAEEAVREIEGLFLNDRDAIQVLHGLAEGLTPTEIQESGKMTPTEYASTQKRIRRRLALHFMNQEA